MKHTHHCRSCSPRYFLWGDPLREGHLSVRFGDFSSCRVFFDGVEMDYCREALAGSPGAAWILADDGRRTWEYQLRTTDRQAHGVHLCPCGGREPCEELLIGEVRVEAKVG